MPSEFDLIRRLGLFQSLQRDEVVLGIGDDAAILDVPAGWQLAVSTDTFNRGVHFPEETAACDIGYKSMAASLSDVAAMGAEPLAVNLSLSMPVHDEEWLAGFARGFFESANQFQVQLMGGDTTHGPLSISVTVFATVPIEQALRRSGAQAGDLIYVTGTLGDAGAALLVLQEALKLPEPQRSMLVGRLNRPAPRVETGMLIRDYASACIDISDGLAADLSHILERSGIAATLYVDQIPLSAELKGCFDAVGGWTVPLNSGDDYELCFTVPSSKQGELENLLTGKQPAIHCIGMTETGDSLRLIMPDGTIKVIEPTGYDHFREARKVVARAPEQGARNRSNRSV